MEITEDQFISKYVELGTMRFPDFAASKKGTVAKYFLSTEPKSLFHAGKSIKAACAKAGSLCVIKSKAILVNVSESNWVQTHVMEAEITVEAPNRDSE